MEISPYAQILFSTVKMRILTNKKISKSSFSSKMIGVLHPPLAMVDCIVSYIIWLGEYVQLTSD